MGKELEKHLGGKGLNPELKLLSMVLCWSQDPSFRCQAYLIDRHILITNRYCAKKVGFSYQVSKTVNIDGNLTWVGRLVHQKMPPNRISSGVNISLYFLPEWKGKVLKNLSFREGFLGRKGLKSSFVSSTIEISATVSRCFSEKIRGII